jgi:hypothetical protein
MSAISVKWPDTMDYWSDVASVHPVSREDGTESFQRWFRATKRVQSPLIGHVCASGHSARLKLKSTVVVRSHRPVRSVSTKNVELAHNGWDWVRGYKYIPYSSIWALLLICSAKKHLSCARKCKSLVRRLWFQNPRLRTSLVHRK